jgi:hypothetical protein
VGRNSRSKYSKYIGVFWHRKRWHAHITHERHTEYLGAFTKAQGEQAAARAFDAAVRKKRKTLKHRGVDMNSKWTLNFATAGDIEEDRGIERESVRSLALDGVPTAPQEDHPDDNDEQAGGAD